MKILIARRGAGEGQWRGPWRLCAQAGKLDGDGKAAAGSVARLNIPMMEPNGPLGERQADSEAAGIPLPRAVHAIEGPENVLDLRFGNSRALIADF